MRRWLTGAGVGLLVGLLGLVLEISPWGLTFEQTVGLTWLFQMRGRATPPAGGAVVVAIDSRTGDQLGLPPLPRDWPRSIHAKLVDALVQRGAAAIAFDVHFGVAKDPHSDQALVDAVARAGNVVLVERLTGRRQPITDQSGRNVGMIWTEGAKPPFPALAKAAAGIASFPLPKEGASVREFWVFKESTGQSPTLPAVALQVQARGQPTARLLDRVRVVAPTQASSLPAVGTAFRHADGLVDFMRRLRSISTQSPQLLAAAQQKAPEGAPLSLPKALAALYAGNAHRFLNFYGPPGTVPRVPFQAVIKGGDPNLPAKALDFAGKVVFVGYSDLFDPGQPDRYYTVFTRDDGVDLSGVEIAATAYDNLLTNRALTPVEPWTAAVLLVLFGLFLGTAVYALPGYIGVPIVLLAVAAYAAGAQLLFDRLDLLAPISTPLLAQAPAALFVGLLAQYLLERRRGQRISAAINYYLPENIVRDLVQNRLEPGKLNQVVYGACLATDMAGFTTIAEGLSPGELAKFLNDYFEAIAAPLKKHKVHVTEFRADAIMCAWIADQPSANPRRQALLAALEAGEAIKDFRQRHDIPGARLRIGLEAGWIYVGHAGGGGRFVYSIVGDPANTASRVEGLNKHVGTQILATGEAVAGLDNLVIRYLGAFQFVGKTEATPIYEVLAQPEAGTDAQLHLCDAFETAMGLYRERRWPEAAAHFESILEEARDDGPATFYLARCRRFMTDPAEAGDPTVVRMDAK